MKNDFFEKLIFRFIVAALLPNVLVVCFWASDMSNDHYPMWRMVVGPYWHLEVFLFWGVIASASLWCVVQFLPLLINGVTELRDELQKERTEQQAEHPRKRIYTETEKEIEASKARFKTLPIEEQNRIIKESEHYAQKMRLEAKALAKKAEEEKLAELAAIKAEEERRRVEANKPENVRSAVLQAFVGRR